MKKTMLSAVVLLVCLTPVIVAQSWTPQNADLLFMSNKDGNSEIYIQRGGTEEWVNLTNSSVSDNWPVWSPDGKRVAFQRRDTARFDIWVMNTDGSGQTQLTNDPDHDYIPSWSPDGKQMTFLSWRQEPADTGRAPHVYIMNVDGSNQRRLIASSLNTSSGVEWSPDGKYLAYTRRTHDQSGDIFIAESNGKNERRLTVSETEYCGAAAFSPDGSQIAFYFADDSSSQIVVMNTDGTGRRVLTAGGHNWYPRWSPDGKWLTYTTYAPGVDKKKDDLDICAVSVNGDSEPILIAKSPKREAESSWKPAQ